MRLCGRESAAGPRAGHTSFALRSVEGDTDRSGRNATASADWPARCIRELLYPLSKRVRLDASLGTLRDGLTYCPAFVARIDVRTCDELSVIVGLNLN